MTDQASAPASDRVTLRRLPDRGHYEPADVFAILDAGHIAHVGVTTPEGPLVLPMAYGRDDDYLYLHGSVANGLLRNGRDAEVCVTVTLLDGLVIARSAFHNSMNYRSAVVRGTARRIEDAAKKDYALKCITDHVVENWDSRRPASEAEFKTTLVLALPLVEISGKVRAWGPVDDEADLGGPQWAGVVPITTTFGQPTPADDVQPGVEPPDAIARLTAQ
ncbi:MAG: pyridoxamine 5'-phosphate oxidase family protein [Actinomycetota bacterium]|nr:pyridoxamine 5'-phosphate oxidase family protein [Actinomycetota bacterium]